MATIRKLDDSEISKYRAKVSNGVTSEEFYRDLQRAFDYFNRELFGGELPHVFMTVQRKKGARGYFWQDVMQHRFDEAKTHELALNPECFDRSTKDILSTLVHEMVHLWQTCYGDPGKNGYHNKEWAAKMHEVGLVPVSLSGGETGMKVTHEIVEGDRFDVAAGMLDITFDYYSAPKLKTAAKSARVTYTCPGCNAKASAKPGMLLVCGECEEEMKPKE